MNLGRLNHIGIATPYIANPYLVIASVAKQSRAALHDTRLPRFTRNDRNW